MAAVQCAGHDQKCDSVNFFSSVSVTVPSFEVESEVKQDHYTLCVLCDLPITDRVHSLPQTEF
jgi:hypothetical protein